MSSPTTLDECTNIGRDDELIITHPASYVEQNPTKQRTERINWANMTKEMGAGSVSRYATEAAAQTAMDIQKGQVGYIPDNGILIIDELDSYIKADVRTVNNGGV